MGVCARASTLPKQPRSCAAPLRGVSALPLRLPSVAPLRAAPPHLWLATPHASPGAPSHTAPSIASSAPCVRDFARRVPRVPLRYSHSATQFQAVRCDTSRTWMGAGRQAARAQPRRRPRTLRHRHTPNSRGPVFYPLMSGAPARARSLLLCRRIATLHARLHSHCLLDRTESGARREVRARDRAAPQQAGSRLSRRCSYIYATCALAPA
mmetsp:Transcript_10623/g.34896  ORF Transcript_10623/g.34896 Transcript_10623/m.34896 type:complete len:210 (+) Transcript_10623:315-944(+)